MWRVFGHRFRRGTLLLAVCVGVMAGLGLARTRYSINPLYVWALLVLVIIVWRRKALTLVVLLVLLGISFGWWRGSLYMQKLDAYEPVYFQKITLTARASEDALYGKTKQLSFAASEIVLENGQRMTGKIQLSGYGVNAVFHGDEVTASGKLYPGFGAYQGRMSFAVLSITDHHPTLVAEIRREFVAGAQTALPEPLAPFVMGLLVGQRANLPADTKGDLQKVGLTHIIAVSGYNLTIILQASRRLLGKRSKRIATILSLALIAVFLLLAGASASIVRAAIVSVLSIAASYYGRSFSPLSLIAFAAAITAWANPVYIWSDLSWYLSFLAFYGVMILSPLVQARWPGRWHQNIIGSVALESVCAEVMSLPFVLHIFGQMSLVGLPANILVVTLVPLAMLLGVVSGLAGMLAASFSGWITWPANFLLTYMLDVAHIMAHLPGIFVENKALSLPAMLAIYLGITLVTTSLWHKTRSVKADTITDIMQPKYQGLLA
ncbi:MAG: hypothetical protein JWO35_417 [Candidatus Saccharibacteria bacterium]|nr:hypothetical protein [Candidatus Saccharibacteria bacterium]